MTTATGPGLLDRRFVVVTGKGGVGRSTLSAAIALAAARRGRRVLVCEFNTKERMPSLLGGHTPAPTESGPRSITLDELGVWSGRTGGEALAEAAEGGGIRRIRRSPGIWTVNIRPDQAMREYGLMKLRVRALYHFAFENRLVRGFLHLVPGLPELLLLGKAYYHETEVDERSGRPVWDMVVVDAPATGHGVSLLRIPQVVLSVVAHGPMAEDARRMRALLVDPVRTSLNIVTLPEAMPVSEALELQAQVGNLLRLPTGYVFVNAVHGAPAAEGPPTDAILRAAGRAAPDLPAAGALLAAHDRRRRRTVVEAEHLARLRAGTTMPVVELPFLARTRWDFDAVCVLADLVTRAVEPGEGPA